jgi:alpha-1,3-fucosyltransferase
MILKQRKRLYYVGITFGFMLLITIVVRFRSVSIPVYFSFNDMSHINSKTRNIEIQRSKNSTPIILLWTPFFGSKYWNDFSSTPGNELRKCPVNNCIITSDRSLFDISSALLYHWSEIDLNDLPKTHPTNQRWVLYNKESPRGTLNDMKKKRDILDVISPQINWTMTYRLDSDIVEPYGKILPRQTQVSWTPKVTLTAKQKEVAWIVSKCNASSNRDEYVQQLSQYIKVDIYGACGPLECKPWLSDQCFEMVERNYKFYLAFENSLCRDYVTEKLIKTMQYDIIPVVFGGANYLDFVPPNSYINALQFQSPKSLALHLKNVGSNESLYNSYLQWKRTHVSVFKFWMGFCDLCKNLQNQSLYSERKKIQNIDNWWFEEAHCATWKKNTLKPLL